MPKRAAPDPESAPPGTRQRMIEATMRLLQRDGYAATSWRGVVEEAGTPWGSAYHHFPGGKEQLAAAAVQLGSDLVVAGLEQCLEQSQTVGDGVRLWFATGGKNLKQSRYRGGCPIATVALETAPQSTALAAVCGASFKQWETVLAARLRAAGLPGGRAVDLATLVVANLEGSLILARVRQSIEPVALAGETMGRLIDAEVAGSIAPSA
jgi:TetR/AcrR family transcriptional regulator, lmrAB and yxaGH operons repressor